MKKTTHKRGLALLLSLMLLLSMLPTAVMAEGENKNTIYTRYVSSNSPTGSGTQGGAERLPFCLRPVSETKKARRIHRLRREAVNTPHL